MPSSDELLARYRECAIRQGEYQLKDSRKAARAFEQLNEVIRALSRAGPATYRQILTLLDDDNIHVRLSASYDALSIEPERGLRVIREIIDGPPSAARLIAKVTLDQWDKGTLHLRQWEQAED